MTTRGQIITKATGGPFFSQEKILILEDLPGGPVLKNLPFSAGDADSIPETAKQLILQLLKPASSGALRKLVSLCTATNESLPHNERSCMMQQRSYVQQLKPDATK